MKLLFICAMGRVRSNAAAQMCSVKHETRYRAIPAYWHDAHAPNEAMWDDFEWADEIIVMENWMVDHLRELEMPNCHTINVLSIRDLYGDPAAPELVAILGRKLAHYL